MVVNARPIKRSKKRVTADLYDFLTFPDAATGVFDGPFRTNIKAFLSEYARLTLPSSILSPPAAAAGGAPAPLLTWRVSFRIGDLKAGEDRKDGEEFAPAVELPPDVDLDVVEEDVARSKSVYCDHCRVGGWSSHPVCTKRYHFIIRNACSVNRSCTRCGALLQSSDFRCTTCEYEMTADDFEDWAYLQLESPSHLLHGVVHTNGYGHLLRVNGREGGSRFLAGCDIMGFWDRLCLMLQVRKVTLMDISKKLGLEYRLLRAVTRGRTWYGNWGYKFGAGSFALTAEAYQKSIDTLANLPLSPLLFFHSRAPRNPLQDVVTFYQSISDSPLVTVRDIFSLLMRLLHEAKKTSPRLGTTSVCKRSPPPQPCPAGGVLCAWTRDDIEELDNTLVKVLRAAAGGSRWVSWRALRGAVCRSAESLLFLDYCLRGLGGKVTGDGMVVAVRCNAETNAIEYRLEAVVSDQQLTSTRRGSTPTEDHLIRDLYYLYDALLNPETMHQYRPQATLDLARESARKLLDCKQFIKDYHACLAPSPNPFLLHVWFLVELMDKPNDYTAPPPELLRLPITATVAELKVEAAKALEETYLVFQRFRAEEVLDHNHVTDSTLVKHLLGGLTGSVRVRGGCLGDHQRLGQFRMERGPENWTVDCSCGARDDDGERMLACDACGVWRHTRCSGIKDCEDVPLKFICGKCEESRKLKTAGRGGGRRKDDGSGRRKDDTSGRRRDIFRSERCKDVVRCKIEKTCSGSSTITEDDGYGCLAQVCI